MRHSILVFLFGLPITLNTAQAQHYCRDALRQPRETQFYVSRTPCERRVGVSAFPSKEAWEQNKGAFDYLSPKRACCWSGTTGKIFISPTGCGHDFTLRTLSMDQCAGQ
jgi:hypothetical protein